MFIIACIIFQHNKHFIKAIIAQAVSEALGTRRKKYNKKSLKIRNDETERLISQKKQAYLRYIYIL